MPFPLAHPAAVWPLRRWCPRHLSLIGLVIGSVTPDGGYVLRELGLQRFSHSLLGSVVFCLPVGCLAAWILLFLRQPLAGSLPSPHREALLPLCLGPWPTAWRLALSVFIGTWTHIGLDALTHESALQARHAEAWQNTVSTVEATGLKFYQVLWLILSGTCLAFLAFWYARFLRRSTGQIRLFDPADRRRVLTWAALLGLPYLAVVPRSYHMFEPGGFSIDKHAVYGSLQPYLLLLSVVVLLYGLSQRRRGGPDQAPN